MTRDIYAFAITLLAMATGFLLLRLTLPRRKSTRPGAPGAKPRDPTRGFRDPCR
jgi:hypothetical protein